MIIRDIMITMFKTDFNKFLSNKGYIYIKKYIQCWWVKFNLKETITKSFIVKDLNVKYNNINHIAVLICMKRTRYHQFYF